MKAGRELDDTATANTLFIEWDKCAHHIVVMHHIGEDGKHYCPTGYSWCIKCGEVWDTPWEVCDVCGKKRPKDETK